MWPTRAVECYDPRSRKSPVTSISYPAHLCSVLNHHQGILQKTVGYEDFDCFCDNFTPEVDSDVISGIVLAKSTWLYEESNLAIRVQTVRELFDQLVL